MMFRRNKTVNRAKLEHKLYLARENPEPVFDISDCGLRDVPSGIYSLCRVFLKESLRLENNCVTSLSGGGNLKDLHFLKILNISGNSFQTLPEDICDLKSLEELYASNNQLKKLPKAVCQLSNLKILDLSHNTLKILPEDVGDLTNLRELDIRSNKSLVHLPKSIHKCYRLTCLQIDSDKFSYPPSEVILGGIEEIRRYICDDIGIPFTKSEIQEEIAKPLSESEDTCDSFHQQKMREFLEIERNNELVQKQEIELANASRANKEKLLAVITEQQNHLDQELNKLQLVKEAERFRLIEQLQEEENKADIMIKQLLTLIDEPSRYLIEQEKQEEEKLMAAVNRYNDTLRREDILSAMNDILEQESARFEEYSQNRLVTTRDLISKSDVDSKLVDILHLNQQHKDVLLAKLKKDYDVQKAAVATLLERGDARSWGLVQQIRMVEAQLVMLTNFELNRKKLQMDQQMNDLCDKRVSLSLLLMDLLDQQKERRSQLISTLNTIEDTNYNTVIGDYDFWLKQYQKLLDKLPEGLSQAQKNIDPALAQALLANGVIHCLPFLAKLMQSEMDAHTITDSDLQEAGIRCSDERAKILDVFHVYKKMSYTEEMEHPSAPPLEEPSAPPDENIKAISSVECVICLDLECQIIFLPCGHLCCCRGCSASIGECPLCRTDIKRKITPVL